MRYPKSVKPHIDALKKYKENESLSEFHILHMYPGKLAFPNGYWDSRYFELVGYNTDSLEFKNLGRHDSIDFSDEGIEVSIVRIFADKSTLIRFKKPVKTGGMQAIDLYR